MEVHAPNPPKTSWRDVIKVHPAVDLFPLLAPEQLTELAEDIRRNGLRQPATVYRDEAGYLVLIDGRNRLAALERLGLPILAPDGQPNMDYFVLADEAVQNDPEAFIASLNLHRRHLTGEQRRELVGKLIKADPTQSSRQVARLANVSPTTAVEVRNELVARGDVSRLDTSTDTLGRRQPTKHMAVKPKVAALNHPKPASKGVGLRSEGVEEITKAIHHIAGGSLDLKPKDVLAALGNEVKRINLLGSARAAHKWLGELLETTRQGVHASAPSTNLAHEELIPCPRPLAKSP